MEHLKNTADIKKSNAKNELSINTPNTLGDQEMVEGGQNKRANKGTEICAIAVINMVTAIPRDLNRAINEPSKTITITPRYNKLAVCPSFPIIPTAAFTQNNRNTPVIARPKATL